MHESVPPLSLTAWLRYDVIKRLIPEGVHRVLEIGVGAGSVGALLASRFDYVGLEPDLIAFEEARRRIEPHGQVVHATAETLEASATFDLVCAFEVLEHIEDDRRALSDWLRHLRPGGWALVSVPQGRHRFGPQDRWVGHHRRYERADLTALLERVGLVELVVVSYGFPLGNALEATRNALARRRLARGSPPANTAGSGRWLQPPAWAALGTRGFTLPFRLSQRAFAGTDLGSGLVARGRRPVGGAVEPRGTGTAGMLTRASCTLRA